MAPIAADIFTDEGESGFREREASALSDALAAERAVVVVGGERSLRAGLSPHGRPVRGLPVRGAAEAAKRVGITGARPLLLGNVRTRWTALMKEREPLLPRGRLAHHRHRRPDPDQIAAAILTILPEETP